MRTYSDAFASNTMLDVAMVPWVDAEDKDRCVGFVKDLIEHIDMKAHGHPVVEHFGDGKLSGWTVSQLIETSHVVAHFMDRPEHDGFTTINWGGLHLDVSSCGVYSPMDVADFVRKRWPSAIVRGRHAMRYLPGSRKSGGPEYDAVAESYDDVYSTPRGRREDEEVQAFMRRSIGRRRKGMVLESMLDIGCGTGAALRLMPLKPRRYVGVDPSRKMLDQFNVKVHGHRFSGDEMRWFCEPPYTEIELREEGFPCDLSCPVPHEFVTAMWSLNYIMGRDLDRLFVDLNRCTSADARMVVATYGHNYADSDDYICKVPGGPLSTQHDGALGIVHKAVHHGWKPGEVRELTGPLQRRLPPWLYDRVGAIDRAINGGKGKFRFTLREFFRA